MGALRLEELIRVAFVALLAAIVAVVVFLTFELVRPAQGASPSGLLYLLALPMLAIAAPTSLVAGIALHLVVRRMALPRLGLLPVFLVLGAVAGEIVSGQWYGTIPLSALTSTVAWGLYCFGPLKLWRFKFDPITHLDF